MLLQLDNLLRLLGFDSEKTLVVVDILYTAVVVVVTLGEVD